jgi:hypothetical protein
MAFTVSEFKSNINKGDGAARPTLYEITIVSSADGGVSFNSKQQILVKAAQIPGATIAAETVNYAGRPLKYSGKRTYENWTTTVINDESFAIRNKVMLWMTSMGGQLEGTRSKDRGGNPDGTTTQTWKEGIATVKQLGANGTVKKTFTLNQLWPTSIAAIPVDWSADGIEEFSVEWCFDTLSAK